MPDVDGIKLARKALELDPELGILFMTGYADVETAKQAIETGAYDYIMKPFELPEIRNAVSAAVAKRKELQKKQGTRGLSHLADLMGALYAVGNADSLIKLILRFALYHFGLKAGAVMFFNKSEDSINLAVNSDSEQVTYASEKNVPAEAFPDALMEGSEVQCCGNLLEHSSLAGVFQFDSFGEIRESFARRVGNYCIFSLPATENLKLILIIHSTDEISVSEVDRQMLTVLLSLSSISLENLILLEEARSAMSRLEDFKDHLIGVERVATQGMMSSEIAHELNNYIAIIFSNLELFEMKSKGQYPEESHKYLENIKNNIQRIEKFTNSLSAAGRMMTKRQSADFNEMIRETTAFARHQRRFRHVKIEFALDDSLPEVFIDVSQLQQILYNLLNNSADAIDPARKDGLIKVTTRYDSNEDIFTLEVEDNGSGFNQENLKKAFKDRFTTKKEGHGFGLTVCRKIIRNHGGDVAVESQEGQGARITITIPCADPRTSENAAANSTFAQQIS
jgi:signal transduction histidine kinase